LSISECEITSQRRFGDKLDFSHAIKHAADCTGAAIELHDVAIVLQLKRFGGYCGCAARQ
jgi:hypothetical protein